MLLLLAVLGVAETADPLTDLGRSRGISHLNFFLQASQINISVTIWTENIAGKLVFYQMDGNATYVRDTGELASDIPTETMFELFDPQKSFSKAKFTYTWDLGNGYEDFVLIWKKYIKWMLGFSLPFMYDLMSAAERWLKGLNRWSAIITQNQGTTHCGWKLGWMWLNMHLYSLTSTPWMSKYSVCSFVLCFFSFRHEQIVAARWVQIFQR